MPPEPPTALEEGLGRLARQLAELSALAQEALAAALDDWHRGSAAPEWPARDRAMFARKQAILKECVALLALQGPLAGDLRTITATLEVSTDLDRVGRYAKDIAELALDPTTPGGAGEAGALLAPMAELTRQLLARALDAFLGRAVEPVRSIRRADDAIDALHRDNFRRIVARMADRSVPPGLGSPALLVNRYLERIADHAVNIGEQAVYMVTGERPSPPSPAGPDGPPRR